MRVGPWYLCQREALAETKENSFPRDMGRVVPGMESICLQILGWLQEYLPATLGYCNLIFLSSPFVFIEWIHSKSKTKSSGLWKDCKFTSQGFPLPPFMLLFMQASFSGATHNSKQSICLTELSSKERKLKNGASLRDLLPIKKQLQKPVTHC